ncbi:hypothetical protein LL252_04570 [Alcanivorax marinus]|uniref:Uncharacterized protein n=1 Tax=Alloalcanivorax marinus TaxID=1177169 RepID=A0A9Q3UK22_9GAMM|nr:hypothetical protein [Alloalcanivorax marinus]MBM7332934.1 hypothetical protein [Alloalcanivorax marinus]MCC4307840.1 hypothetical protein [Alloalcanivorax marinus]MCH2558888.1 hypothetical protein [Alcanivorax sp.]MCU5785302.1 hypothetical protein [Alloalcanivorax marinus]
MSNVIHRLAALGVALMLAMPVTAAWAQPAEALRVEYQQWQIGRDGVRQQMDYAETLYREENALWVEREIPEAAERQHDQHAHGGLGHKHADVIGAPLWIRRDDQGGLDVKLVDRHEKRLIDIAPPYYGNVGFDGHWAESWALADPRALAAMQPASIDEQGRETYQLDRGDQRITLVWDPKGRYAVSITAQGKQGLSGRTLRATPLAAPASMPWQGLADYRDRDYSDLLD